MSEKRFPITGIQPYASRQLEMRAECAWEVIIRGHSVIAGDDGGEDSQGRAKLRLQPPAELVKRAFEIADIFVDTVEARGDLRVISREELLTAEEEIQEYKANFYARQRTNKLNENLNKG